HRVRIVRSSLYTVYVLSSQHRGNAAWLQREEDQQDQTGDGDDSQPRGGEFTVETPDVAEGEAAVQLVDPGSQGQGPGGAVDGEVAGHLGGGGIDEDRPGFAFAQLGRGSHPSGGRPGVGSGADGAERVLVSGDGVRGFDLFGQGQGRSRGRSRELVGVDDLLKLWAERVERTAECGDEDERA